MKRDPAEHIVGAVLALGRRLRAERPRGTASLSGLSILSTLLRSGAMPATRLAAEERLQPQSLTRLIAGLEAKGWIARKRNPTDRREISISLTARGRRLIDDDRKSRRAWLKHALATTLTASERATLLAAADVMLKLAR